MQKSVRARDLKIRLRIMRIFFTKAEPLQISDRRSGSYKKSSDSMAVPDVHSEIDGFYRPLFPRLYDLFSIFVEGPIGT